MNIEEILPGIHHVTEVDAMALGDIFVRFQEHYESSHFKDQIFTKAEYEEWYKTNLGNGVYDYGEAYSGFNLPAEAFELFAIGLFDPLTEQEQKLIDYVKDLKKPFYIIGSLPSDVETWAHEMCHAMWYMDPEYKRKAQTILKQFEGSFYKIEPLLENLDEFKEARDGNHK